MNSQAAARALVASVAVAAAMMLAGCDTDSVVPSGRAQAPLSQKTAALLEEKQMDKDSPILIRMFKEEAEAEIWKKNRSGEYALLKTYPICRWSGDLGPKMKEGDRQAPEGFYSITPGQMNPNSNYYLAFNTGYPNAFDRAWNRTGSELMVHGDCSSRGCYAMTDEQMVEIYALAREAFFGGQKAFQLQAYPFRMTASNLAKHRNNHNMAFWRMLKVGSDHFEVTHQEPRVNVCDRHYVFDAAAPAGSTKALSFNPRGKCPAYEVPTEIASAVAERQQHDNAEYAELVSRNIAVVASHAGVDGGMHPSFYNQMHTVGATDNDGRSTGETVLVAARAPGALPRTPNNPPAQVNPPAQFQLASATSTPAVTAEVPVPAAAPLPKVGSAPEPQNESIGGLLGKLFSSPATAEAATSAEAPQGEAAAEPADAPAPAPAKPAQIARTKTPPSRSVAAAPAAHKPATSHVAAAKPQPPALKPRITEDTPTANAAASAAVSNNRTAFTAQPQTSASLLSGAQPVVPTGTFESRWSGLR